MQQGKIGKLFYCMTNGMTKIQMCTLSFFLWIVFHNLFFYFLAFENHFCMKLNLDDRPVSQELQGYMEELAGLTDKLSIEITTGGVDAPCVRVCRADGTETGLAFHGVPGGHEFTSFVLGLYNAAGPGQPMEEDVRAAVQSIDVPVDIKVLVTLTCTMCPELVTAAQRVAAENERVTAEIYDVNHFPALREKYNVMSVPCLVVNDGETVSFGKKNIRQLLDLLKK